MQICHESQSPEIAKAVGKRHFEKEVSIGDVKLTVIDIIAMCYMLKHYTSVCSIRYVCMNYTTECMYNKFHFSVDN